MLDIHHETGLVLVAHREDERSHALLVKLGAAALLGVKMVLARSAGDHFAVLRDANPLRL